MSSADSHACGWCGHVDEHDVAVQIRGEHDVPWCVRCASCQNEAFLLAGDRASEMLSTRPQDAVARLDQAGFTRDGTGDWRRSDWHVEHALPTVLALRWVFYADVWGSREHAATPNAS